MENVQVIVNQEVGKIDLNFEEMKQFLEARLEEYKTAVFSDESIKDAKKYVAYLRKEQQALKSRITNVKKEYMQPFEDFKKKADALVLLYDEPIDFINGQVKDYEECRKAERRARISEIYESTVPEDLKEYIPLSKIFNDKWENATFKEKDIKQEIITVSDSVSAAVSTIKGMQSDSVPKALAMYKNDLSLSSAISYINNYETQKAEILRKEQERQRQEEIERIRREERERLEAEQRAREEQEAIKRKAEEEKIAAVEAAREEAAQEVIDSLIPDVEGETSLYEYRMSLTADQKEKLEMYLDSVGIEWEMM